MCLIVASESGKLIDLADLEIAYNNNPDGAGVMWLDGGRVHQLHTVPKTFAEVRDLAYHCAGKPHAMHLRYCTRGKVNQDNCHPFTVLNKDEGDEHDLTLMHNGTFQWITFSDEHKKMELSDTAIFAGRLQKNFREHTPTNKITLDHIFDNQIVDRFSKRVSSWNKVVFLDSNGRWSYLNKTAGEIRNEMWYSNTYSLKVGYRDKQVAHHGPSTTKSYTWVNSSSASSSSGSAISSSTTSTNDSSYKSRYTGKKKVTFQRSGINREYVYLVETDGFSDNFYLVDPQTMRFVNGDKRLGKSERKKLKAFLANEKKLADLRDERKLERKTLVDSKGRKIVTVGSEKAAAKDSLDTEDTVPLAQLDRHFAESLMS